jgi:hypothetical protein
VGQPGAVSFVPDLEGRDTKRSRRSHPAISRPLACAFKRTSEEGQAALCWGFVEGYLAG